MHWLEFATSMTNFGRKKKCRGLPTCVMGLARCTKVQFATFQSHEFITVLVHRKESLQNAPAVKFVKTVYVKIGDLCCKPVAICNLKNAIYSKEKSSVLCRKRFCHLGQIEQ